MIGVRIEQSQKKINAIQYGKRFNHPALGAAPYKLAVQTSKTWRLYLSACVLEDILFLRVQ